MRIRPAADRDLELIVGWLAQPRIARWLDFGSERPPTALGLKYALGQGGTRLFTYAPADPAQAAPVGVVGLSSIQPRFRTALLWYALGEPRFAGRGLTARAAAEVVRIGFEELDLRAINAWVVDGNEASVRILESIGFQRIGRQRQCHRIDSQPRDRLLFDIMASEFTPRRGRHRAATLAQDAWLACAGLEGALHAGVPWG
jgi:RimJ/RimL family protein N-acetyltransferase